MEAPKCLNCGRELEIVWQDDHADFTWNPKGFYESNFEDAILVCPICGTNVESLFPDGVCNYSREE